MDIYLVLCDPDFIQTLLTVHDKTIQKYEKKKRGKKKNQRFVGDQPSLHSASRQV